jgi:hypothetical protein
VTLRLTPGGTISGTVLDDGGEPLSGCPLWLLGPADNANQGTYVQKNGTSTNDKGEYKFDALTADRYLVYVRCQQSLPVERPLSVWRPEMNEPAESWLPVFYPDSPVLEGAQWLTVLPGTDLSGIDFHLKPTPVTTVTGAISGLAPATPGIQPNIQLFPGDGYADPSLAYGAAFDVATSTFRIQMVPPGLYRLIAVSSPVQPESLAYANMTITVGRGAPPPLLVHMRPGLSLSGVVEQPPAAGGAETVMLNSLQVPGRQTPVTPGLGELSLVPASAVPFYNWRQVQVRHDGTFTMTALMPGRYRVIARIASPQGSSVESVQFGSAQPSPGLIELTEAASGPLRVRMGAAPQVSANLADAPAGGAGRWMVYALPADEPTSPYNQVMGGPGKSGDTVPIQNATTGKFSFVAVELTMNGAINNQRLNQLLRERAEPVEIVAGPTQTISPKFFTSQEIEHLALAYLRGETR